MQWTDTAIVLSARKHGENSAVVRLFSRSNGVTAGVVRGIHSKTKRGMIQPGNTVSATWQARLSEQLGSFTCELIEASTAHMMADSARLSALVSATTLIETTLPERHPYQRFYQMFQSFITILRDSEFWPEAYVQLELELLSETGFGLDLSECAATGVREDIIYVSPKSGRGVCREAGEPYRTKLLPLPPFLSMAPKKNRVESAEILDGLRLTGYFLDHWLLAPHNRKLPAARARLMQTLTQRSTELALTKEPLPKEWHGTEETIT